MAESWLSRISRGDYRRPGESPVGGRSDITGGVRQNLPPDAGIGPMQGTVPGAGPPAPQPVQPLAPGPQNQNVPVPPGYGQWPGQQPFGEFLAGNASQPQPQGGGGGAAEDQQGFFNPRTPFGPPEPSLHQQGLAAGSTIPQAMYGAHFGPNNAYAQMINTTNSAWADQSARNQAASLQIRQLDLLKQLIGNVGGNRNLNVTNPVTAKGPKNTGKAKRAITRAGATAKPPPGFTGDLAQQFRDASMATGQQAGVGADRQVAEQSATLNQALEQQRSQAGLGLMSRLAGFGQDDARRNAILQNMIMGLT